MKVLVLLAFLSLCLTRTNNVVAATPCTEHGFSSGSSISVREGLVITQVCVSTAQSTVVLHRPHSQFILNGCYFVHVEALRVSLIPSGEEGCPEITRLSLFTAAKAPTNTGVQARHSTGTVSTSGGGPGSIMAPKPIVGVPFVGK